MPLCLGTYQPAMHLATWDSHPSEDLPELPSLAVTVCSRSALGLDRSIIITFSCLGLRSGCAQSVEFEKTSLFNSLSLHGSHVTCTKGKVADTLIFTFRELTPLLLTESYGGSWGGAF